MISFRSANLTGTATYEYLVPGVIFFVASVVILALAVICLVRAKKERKKVSPVTKDSPVNSANAANVVRYDVNICSDSYEMRKPIIISSNEIMGKHYGNFSFSSYWNCFISKSTKYVH
jgi:hypothetical protein